MSELTLEQALILLDESRQHNAAMLDRLYESLGIDSSDGEIRFKWAMIAIEDVKRERDSALAQNAELAAQVALLCEKLKDIEDTESDKPYVYRLQAKQALRLVNGSPTQHLRDRDAEVGRAGFVAGVQYAHKRPDVVLPKVIEMVAWDYSERVKDGEL